MKIIVVSDSHSLTRPLDYILEKHKDADLFLHCGDVCLNPEMYPQFQFVCGNNDYYDLPLDRIVDLKGSKHRIFMLHSHMVSFYNREKTMSKIAKKNGCDIVCYGHTHVAFYEKMNGVYILNPGSVYLSRDGKQPSYAILTIDENDEITVRFEHLD